MFSQRLLPAVATRLAVCIAALFVNNAFPKPTLTDKVDAWDPNYCNESKLQEGAGLAKTALGQFLGYQCDSIFFHCRWGVDGWRTYKKTCRKGLVYDTTGTQNCNYDFNVDGCGMKQCADCLSDQYACCLSEECVDSGMRCDGKYDCTLEEDEQNCPTCGSGQFPCVLSEQCVEFDKRCNGAKDCKDGTDEHYCEGIECPAGNFFCRNSKKCIELKVRCDGKRDCNLGEDEAFCGPEEKKEYTCTDQVHSVPKQEVCNGVDDCPDGSDELYCMSTTQDEESASGPGILPFNTAHLGAHTGKLNSTKLISSTLVTGADPAAEEGEMQVEDEEAEEDVEDHRPQPGRSPSISGLFATSPSAKSRISTQAPSVSLLSSLSAVPTSTVSIRGSLVTGRHILSRSSMSPGMTSSTTTTRPKTVAISASTTPVGKEDEYFYDEAPGS